MAAISECDLQFHIARGLMVPSSIIRGLFNDAFQLLRLHIVSNDMISELLVGKDVREVVVA
jgi:hypothetical protein